MAKKEDANIELGKLWDAVMEFAEEMYDKLEGKYHQGYMGWDDPAEEQYIYY